MVSALISSVASIEFGATLGRENRITQVDLNDLPEDTMAVDKSPETQSGSASKDKEDSSGLTDEERRQLDELRSRDQEVRAHEQAHMAAGAGLVQGGPKYTLTKGPDGNLYATGGSVQIDTSTGATPEATIEKARQIRAAALAPSNPSSQDMSVASRASMMELQARGELASSEDASSAESEEGSIEGAMVETSMASRSYTAHNPSDANHLAQCPECRAKAFEGRYEVAEASPLGIA